MLKAAARRNLRAHVAKGGLIAYATASCFGIGCDPRNKRAVQKLLRVKRRPQKKGLILIGNNFADLRPFVKTLSAAQQKIAEEKWPGPHTWLMAASRRTSRLIRGRHAQVALRADAHPEAREVCKLLGMAITSSSLNRAGRVPVRTYREARRQFGESVLVLPGRTGSDKSPSTIQDFETGRLIRRQASAWLHK